MGQTEFEAIEQGLTCAGGLLKACLLNDADAIAVAATLPAEAWPDRETKSVGRAIASIHASGETVDWAAIHAEMAREGDAPRGPATILSDLTAPPENGGPGVSCDAERDRRTLIEALAKRERAEHIRMLGAADADGDVIAFREILHEITHGAPEIQSFCNDLSNWRDLAAQPVPWAFDGTIPDNTVSIIGGPGGLGKTALARALTLSMMTGYAVLPSFAPTRRGPVMVLSGEDSAPLYLRGLLALAREHGISRDDMDSAMQRLHLRALDSKPFLARDERGNVGTTEYFTAVSREAQRTGAKLIIIDTLSKHFGGDSENDNVLMAAFIEACANLAQAVRAAVIIIHHTRKGIEGSSHHALRGGGAVGDNARCVWILKRDGDRITAENLKQNYGPHVEPVDLEFRGGALIEVTESRNPALLVPTIVDWIKDHPDARVTLGAVVSTQGDGGDLRRHLSGCHPWAEARHIHPAFTRAIEQGLLKVETIKDRTSRRTREVLRCAS